MGGKYMVKTRICDILNIKYPIIQGGMAWVATAELAALLIFLLDFPVLRFGTAMLNTSLILF